MSSTRRECLLTLISSANRAGDTEAVTEAIRCAPVGILSRWDSALLSLLPTLDAARCLTVEYHVDRGVLDVHAFAYVLGELDWSALAIYQAARNVSTLPAWGTPDERDAAATVQVVA